MKKLLIFIFIFFTFVTSTFANNTDINRSFTQTGLVKDIEYVDLLENEYIQTKQVATIELIDGDDRGKLITVDNILTANPCYDITLKRGMKVLLNIEETDEEKVFSITDIKRSGVLIWLSFIFCALLIYVGKKKGIYSLVSIILTVLLIINLLSPLILAGISPIFSAILICLISTAITMYLVGGFNRKSTSATLGCFLSIIIASILSILTAKFAYLTGFTGEYSMFLYSMHPEFNFVSITISTMILATLGAVMDVAMSIASTINEIYTVDNTKTIKELFICGMNVGRDIIGTMANTLILVYLGSSLPLLLLASNIDMQKFINLNQVVTEVSSALIGSSAIVICVPITALIASKLIKKTPEKFNLKLDN